MARNFAQMIANIRKSDDALRAAVSECAAYILLQFHVNNRKVDGAGVNLRDQMLGALPAWLVKEAGKWQIQSGKRVPGMSEREAAMRADAFVGMAFAAQEEKRRIAKENREARKASRPAKEDAPETASEQSAPEVPLLKSALIDSTGNMMELSDEELHEAICAVLAVRTAQLRIAA